MDDLVPILVAQLGHVHAERDEHVERVARRHTAFGQCVPQADGLGLGVAFAEQFRLEQVEISELLVRRQRGVVGDVVGGANEIVIRQDQRAMARMNDPGRDGKILVAVTLAGSQFARRGHRGLVYNRLDRKGFFARAGLCRRCRRGPHIGEYGRKTNPVSRWLPFRIRPEKAAPGPPLWASGRAYWLWVFRTWSQACEILARFSLRQARMVKSPWSMTGRQNFCTSRVQAF